MKYILILGILIILLSTIRYFLRSSKKGSQSFKPEIIDTVRISTKMSPVEFAEKYNSHRGEVKGGTLCFWGHWFGRPFDNYHRIVSVNFDTRQNILTIRFNEEEILSVTNPGEVEVSSGRMSISYADRIHWQWYYYGKTKKPENLYFYDIVRHDSTVIGSTNTNKFKTNWSGLSITEPAVLLT